MDMAIAWATVDSVATAKATFHGHGLNIKTLIDQGCKHTQIQACKDKAIYEVSELLVILVFRISECVSNKGLVAVGSGRSPLNE